MSKHEDTVTAARTLLESVGASFDRIGGSMRETSARLEAALLRIRAVQKPA